VTERDGDDKERIRERLRERRRSLAETERREASREVCERLASWAPTAKAGRLAGYLSFDNEVDVEPFLERRLERDRPVALPRVVDVTSMEYADVADFGSVEEGSFGIREPVGEACALRRLEVFLVPGVGFDRDGGRVGMGWGYYDRTLGRRRAADTESDALFVGICYDCQLSNEALPTDAHDVDMDAVVTERELITCSECAPSA